MGNTKSPAASGRHRERIAVATTVMLLGGLAGWPQMRAAATGPAFPRTAASVTIPAVGGPVVVVKGVTSPNGVAVDSRGTLYIASALTDRVVKVVAGSNTLVPVGSGLDHPRAVAVDSHGTVYIADTGHNRVVKVSPGHALTTIATALFSPDGVAVDGHGNVYIADTFHNRIVKVPASAMH